MVKLEIVADDAGNVYLTGPLQNKVLCLGLLEMAKDVVKTYQPPKIHTNVPANGLPNLRRVE